MKLKSSLLRNLVMACYMIGLAGVASASPPPGLSESGGLEKAAEHSNKVFNREEALRKRREVHEWLMSEAVPQGLGVPISAVVSADEMYEIDHTPRSVVPERVGLTKPLSVSISLNDVSLSRLKGRVLAGPNGAMSGTADGGYVFTTTLRSPEATALRVHFTGFRLPANAGVFLFTEDGQVFGPYTGRGPHGDGEFWSHTLMGDTVFLQLRHVGPATREDLNGTGFDIAGLGHIRPRFLGGHCSVNASCVVNAECGVAEPAVDIRDAVAHMQWISRSYIYICTGGLLADTDENTTIPYFLSANHCISHGKDARNLENFFQLKAPCGTNDCEDIFDHRANHPQELRTLGAKIKSTGKNTDYTLFELKGAAPIGSSYLGWNAQPVAGSEGQLLFRISHPSGAPQAYSEHVVDTNATECRSWPRGDRIYSKDVEGATEGGSSGSPVVNDSSQVVGQLSGACGTNVNEVCDNVNNATVDGAFAAYYDEVASFLDPDPGSCQPEPEICDDDIDNDCDGLVDGDDPDCQGGGDGLKGAPCLVDSDCASNKCRGKPGSMTCK